MPATPPFPVAPHATEVLQRLWAAGHGAWLVGGAVRDALLGRPTHDWDVATDARPETILGIFPEGAYENRFGTVLALDVEITTFRRDHHYPDHRRPAEVTFTDAVDEDLVRRDFTVNAIAWGREAGGRVEDGRFEDPANGRADLDAGILRAVGLRIEPGTRDAMRRHADDVRWVSRERVGIELRRMLEADPPSRAFRILEQTGLLGPTFPDLGAQVGVPQAKGAGMDCWDHTLATLDAAAALVPGDEPLLACALFHDAGKPATMADGHFVGHEVVGSVLAEAALTDLAWSRREARLVSRVIAAHMFHYADAWSDAAVRRFIRRTGADILETVFALRRADNVGSGGPPDDPEIDGLRRRVGEQLAAGVPLAIADLAVNGSDLVAAIGRPPGPWVGAMLERLLDSVTNDPSRNLADQSVADVRAWLAADERHEGERGRPHDEPRG